MEEFCPTHAPSYFGKVLTQLNLSLLIWIEFSHDLCLTEYFKDYVK